MCELLIAVVPLQNHPVSSSAEAVTPSAKHSPIVKCQGAQKTYIYPYAMLQRCTPCTVLLERLIVKDKMLDKGKKKVMKIEISKSKDESDDEEILEDDFIDLFDDNSIIDEESDQESRKRKKSDDEDFDDRLDDEDYDVIEENLGFKIQRKGYKRLKKMEDSEEEEEQEMRDEKVAIANELFSNDLRSSDEDEKNESIHSIRPETDLYDEESSEESENDFIVDDKGKLSAYGNKKKEKHIHDPALEEAHLIFGVDLDYNDNSEKEEEEEEEDEYTDEEYVDRSKKTKKLAKKNTKKKTIFEIYDRSELKRGYYTEVDSEICIKDIPERMQLRAVPITSATEEELVTEAKWIYHQIFQHKTISKQDAYFSERPNECAKRGPQTVAKIQKVLDFIRNQHFEVSFIYFYRKEYIFPELTTNDLWKIYKFDASWQVLQQRKAKLLIQFKKIKRRQEDHIKQDPQGPLPDSIRLIDEEDLNQLKTAQTMEELNDYWKQTVRCGPYATCRRAGLDRLVKKFGLTPQQFAENLNKMYQVYEVKQEPTEPSVIAAKYVGRQFQTVDEVLKAAKFMVAYQLSREPLVRETIRNMYKEKAMISVQPTKKGIKEIDEHHAIYTMKYLKEKPVSELTGDQYLKLVMAEKDRLITINFSDEIGCTFEGNIDKIKLLYYRDEDIKSVEDWNVLRLDSVEMALTKMIIPDLKKEMHFMLLSEAKDYVMRSCVRKMHNWIEIAPYHCEFPKENNEKWDTSKGLRVMGIAFVPDDSEAGFACIVAPDGRCTDFLKLPHLLKKKLSINELNKTMKEADMRLLRNFIVTKKPHVVVIGGESPDALMIAEDVKDVIFDLFNDDKIPDINVEIIENELARVYASSHQGISEFGNYPETLRQAISLARRLQDPLVEFSQLCNADDEILCLAFHILQKQLSKEDLLENIYMEFINRVNEVGVDLNKIIRRPHAANLLQFVCGLGPRKARSLIKNLKQTNQRLENRKQLLTSCHVGPKVFVNCAGFIKIDTDNLDDSTETEIDLLDGSRIHPESYAWAKQMAVDVLEYDDKDVDLALQDVLESSERLEDLDLDAFADELEVLGYGKKSITLNNIRSELTSRYKDLRTPYEALTPEELLFTLTKETPETFCIGKLIEATVIGINYRKTKADQLEEVHPVRNGETSLWQCPLCHKSDFLELPEVWSHLDSENCPGKAIGVRLRLDNGMYGFIHIKNLSDEEVDNPLKLVHIGKRIQCRVIKMEVDRFSADMTSKDSDLADINQEWRPLKDPCYDTEAEEKDNLAEETKKIKQQLNTYVPRFIIHPCFRNVTYAQAEVMMQTMMQGEAIIRPSSKGNDHLTVTWKVTDDIYQHIDVREEGKENAHSLGRSLCIGMEQYEDIDEVLSRHINPMAAYAAELLDFKYYKAEVMGRKEKAEKLLRKQKNENPMVTPYIVSASKNYPGNFLLSYIPNSQCCHEYISISQNGFEYRDNQFHRVNDLFSWFKNHFMDSITGNGLSNTFKYQ